MTAENTLVGNGRTFRNPTQQFNQPDVLSPVGPAAMPQVDLTAGLGTGVQRDSFGFSSHSVGVRRASGIDRATSFQAVSSNRSTPGPEKTSRSCEENQHVIGFRCETK